MLGNGFLRSPSLVVGGKDRVTLIEGVTITLARLLSDFQHQGFFQGVEELLLVGAVFHILHFVLYYEACLVDAIGLKYSIQVDDVNLCFHADA